MSNTSDPVDKSKGRCGSSLPVRYTPPEQRLLANVTMPAALLYGVQLAICFLLVVGMITAADASDYVANPVATFFRSGWMIAYYVLLFASMIGLVVLEIWETWFDIQIRINSAKAKNSQEITHIAIAEASLSQIAVLNWMAYLATSPRMGESLLTSVLCIASAAIAVTSALTCLWIVMRPIMKPSAH